MARLSAQLFHSPVQECLYCSAWAREKKRTSTCRKQKEELQHNRKQETAQKGERKDVHC